MSEDPTMARSDALEEFLADPSAKAAMDHVGVAPGEGVLWYLLMMAFNSGYVAGARYVLKEVAP